jgi:membrane-associated protease RseP (regulator of RpoE activity)
MSDAAPSTATTVPAPEPIPKSSPTPLPLLKEGDRPRRHLTLFLFTVASAFLCYLFAPLLGREGVTWGEVSGAMPGAAAFAVSALAIMAAHEFGHFFFSRRHGVDCTLPFFIPLPIPVFQFGTLGAVIRIKTTIPTRNALVDIGAAGPLGGLLVAIPLTFVGMALSRVGPAGPIPPVFMGNASLIGLLTAAYRAVVGLPSLIPTKGALIYGDPLLLLGVQQLVKGTIPDGMAVYAHPVLVAAWFGMVITMLNLMPIGQLDGGHLTHAWFGPRAIPLGKLAALAMGLLVVFVSFSWLPWVLLTSIVVGFKHPPVERPEEPLSNGRKLVCLICLVFLALCLIPAPVQAGAAP